VRPAGGGLAALLAAGLAGAALLGCHRDGGVLRVSGTVEIRELALAPLAAGRVARLLKDEGDTVRRGDTIAVLEQPGLDAVIAQRRAQARAAALRTAEIAAAAADSARAANEQRRAEPLRARGVVSPQQFDALAAAATAAAARLQAVRAAARDAAAAAAALRAALATRDQLTVLAPADGVVLTRFADRGEVLAAGMPVVSVGLVTRPWVRAYVGEREIARVRLGAPATIRLDGAPRAPRAPRGPGAAGGLAARVVDIAPRAEFTPRVALTERERADLVFAVKVEPDAGDAGGRLKAGLPVTVEIPLGP
jgi:HlyD family secretion protein